MKKTIILLADGFEEIEAISVIDILRRADVECVICSVEDKEAVIGAHQITVKPDVMLKEFIKDGYDVLANEYDAVILPGGLPGATTLRDSDRVIEMVKEFFRKDKIVAAICAAPIVLERAGLTEGRTITSYPDCLEDESICNYTGDMVSRDKNIITGRAPGAAANFAYTILEALGLLDKANDLRKGMFF